MTQLLAQHGTERGYRQEIRVGKACTRCQNAHRLYQSQFGIRAKAAGIRYDSEQVIDHLYKGPAKRGRKPVNGGATASTIGGNSHGGPAAESGDRGTEQATAEPAEARFGQMLRERLAESLGSNPGDGGLYVVTEDAPPYLTAVEPDPDMADEDPQWKEKTDEQFVINAEALKTIESNLGTYLSVFGMTLEMIDPYCGPILGENFDNIIKRWVKVIARYPKAANMFMDGRGGIIMDWIGALQATWPVLIAIYHHHLAKDVKMKDGKVYEFKGHTIDGDVDATTPPMKQTYDYSAV